jgi:hypothetical protein
MWRLEYSRRRHNWSEFEFAMVLNKKHSKTYGHHNKNAEADQKS